MLQQEACASSYSNELKELKEQMKMLLEQNNKLVEKLKLCLKTTDLLEAIGKTLGFTAMLVDATRVTSSPNAFGKGEITKMMQLSKITKVIVKKVY